MGISKTDVMPENTPPNNRTSLSSQLEVMSENTPAPAHRRLRFSLQSVFEEEIKKKFIKINETLDQHSIMLNELVRINMEQVKLVPKPNETPEFPINTLKEFLNFNEKLTSEQLRTYKYGE